MPLTPVEIRHVELQRAWLRGYKRSGIDRLLTEIADSFEEVWRERADLADRLEELEAEATKHRELEALLRLDARLGRARRPGHEGAGPTRVGPHRPGGARRGSAHHAAVDRGATADRRGDAEDPRDAAVCPRGARESARRERGEGRESSCAGPEEGRRGHRERHPQGRRLGGGRAHGYPCANGRPEHSSVGSSRRGCEMSLDLAQARGALTAERTRLLASDRVRQSHPVDDGGDGRPLDRHRRPPRGQRDRDVHARARRRPRGERSTSSGRGRRRSPADRRRLLRDLRRLRAPDRRGAARGRPVRDALHGRQARRGEPGDERARPSGDRGRRTRRARRLDGERAAADLVGRALARRRACAVGRPRGRGRGRRSSPTSSRRSSSPGRWASGAA